MSSYVIILFDFLFIIELVFYSGNRTYTSSVAEILPGFKMRQKNIILCKAFITTRGKKIASSNKVGEK